MQAKQSKANQPDAVGAQRAQRARRSTPDDQSPCAPACMQMHVLILRAWQFQSRDIRWPLIESQESSLEVNLAVPANQRAGAQSFPISGQRAASVAAARCRARGRPLGATYGQPTHTGRPLLLNPIWLSSGIQHRTPAGRRPSLWRMSFGRMNSPGEPRWVECAGALAFRLMVLLLWICSQPAS